LNYEVATAEAHEQDEEALVEVQVEAALEEEYLN
jgi:hypothetical protein